MFIFGQLIVLFFQVIGKNFLFSLKLKCKFESEDVELQTS